MLAEFVVTNSSAAFTRTKPKAALSILCVILSSIAKFSVGVAVAPVLPSKDAAVTSML